MAGIERIFGGVAHADVADLADLPLFHDPARRDGAVNIAVHEGRREFDARPVHSADDLAAFLNAIGKGLLRKDMLARGGRLDAVLRGVQMEAKSVEDNGDGILFNVYCFNEQPGIAIDYATGNSHLDNSVTESSSQAAVSDSANV